MSLLPNTLGAIAAATVAVSATRWRASVREAATNAAYPPSGDFLTVDGQRLHFEARGTGPDLVMIHGASGSLRDLTFSLRDRLADRFRVTVIDRPGLGHSDPMPDASLRAQALLLKAAVARLGVKDPVLLGQSYGGSVALAWALTGGPRALVLVGSPSLPWPGKLDPWYRLTSTRLGRALAIPLASALVPQSYVATTTANVFAPDPVPPGYAEHLGAALALRRASLAANAAQVNALRAELVAMEPQYPRLTLPVELIHGDRDSIVPLAVHSGPLSQLLPKARLTVIEGGGHMPHHANEQAVIDAVHRAALHNPLQSPY